MKNSSSSAQVQVPSSVPSSPPQLGKKNIFFDDILLRLKTAVGVKQDQELANILNIGPGNISSAKSKGQIPPSWIIKISVEYGVSSDWILYGESQQTVMTDENIKLPRTINGDIPTWPEIIAGKALSHALKIGVADFGICLVRKVRARLCAGTGSMETNDDMTGLYAFREDWLMKKGSQEHMVLMDVTGDSMEPKICDGDTVLIDQSKTDIYTGGIYAIGIDDEVMVKCVDKAPGKYLLRSLNRNYEPIEIDLAHEHLNVRILGRVIWWCREAR